VLLFFACVFASVSVFVTRADAPARWLPSRGDRSHHSPQI